VSIRRDPRSPFWHYNFQINGRRFFGSTKRTDKREAAAVELAERGKAKAFIAQAKATDASLRLDDIAGRFWDEKGQHHVGCENTEHRLELLIQFLGKDILLTDITDDHVAKLKAWRRGHRARGVANATAVQKNPHETSGGSVANATLIAPATVNHTIATLRELFTYAKLMLRVRFDHEPHWKKHWLKVPTERVRELADDEADRLDAAMHDDWQPFFAFVRASGLRLNECLLRWSEVEARQIVKIGKGGRRVVTPITSEIRDILWPLRGHHPEMVFTFVRRANKNTYRHPMTYAGVQTYWRRLRLRAGVEGFRFHDFRHDLASKALRETGNLKLVSRMLNHRDLRSTLRYAHVLDSEVAEAMERVSKLRKNRRVRLKVV
jgi:integrase